MSPYGRFNMEHVNAPDKRFVPSKGKLESVPRACLRGWAAFWRQSSTCCTTTVPLYLWSSLAFPRCWAPSWLWRCPKLLTDLCPTPWRTWRTGTRGNRGQVRYPGSLKLTVRECVYRFQSCKFFPGLSALFLDWTELLTPGFLPKQSHSCRPCPPIKDISPVSSGDGSHLAANDEERELQHLASQCWIVIVTDSNTQQDQDQELYATRPTEQTHSCGFTYQATLVPPLTHTHRVYCTFSSFTTFPSCLMFTSLLLWQHGLDTVCSAVTEKDAQVYTHKSSY